MRSLLHFCLFLIFCFSVSAQNKQNPIRIYDQSQLLALINIKDDTTRLFNFWATWCRPCVHELPYLEEFGQSMVDSSFRQYLISLDFKEEIDKKLIPFIQKKKLNSQVIVFDGGNPNEWIDSISPQWSGTIPTTLIVHDGFKSLYEGNYKNASEILDHYINCKYHEKN